MKASRLLARHAIVLSLGIFATLAACVGKDGVDFVPGNGTGEDGSAVPPGGDSSAEGAEPGAGGNLDGRHPDGSLAQGGSSGQDASGEPATDASGDRGERRDGAIAEKMPEGGSRDAASEGAGVPPESGAESVVFNFDLDPDFAFWRTLTDVDGVSPGGTLVLLNDDAIPGHVPARALQWSVTFTDFQTGVRALARFPQPMNWSGRTALHLSLKITSGAASLQTYQLYVQTGGPSYASRYLDAQPIGPIADNGAVFHDVSISLANTTISASVAFFGLVLHPAPRAPGSTGIADPTLVEIDNIWLE